ncbi:MAG: response regulator transcription factor [candidate division NC10 bacterium]|nr:response regulator transcription factor [candidate division NC10 bacterium]
MAAILIVADDGLAAGHMARTLRQAGHTAILASDARSVLQEARDCSDLVLLELGSPDLPGEELLGYLKSQPETAHIPVLVITGRREAVAPLEGSAKGCITDILLKPVSGAQLREAVDRALAAQLELDADALRRARSFRQQLILRLIAEGPDLLVYHIYRRICADRTRMKSPRSADALTWTEIAEWGMREGLLDGEQARLLRRVPLVGPERTRTGAA